MSKMFPLVWFSTLLPPKILFPMTSNTVEFALKFCLFLIYKLYVTTFTKKCLETSATKRRTVATVFLTSHHFLKRLLRLEGDWLNFTCCLGKVLTFLSPCLCIFSSFCVSLKLAVGVAPPGVC